MADVDVRELERKWRATGSPDDAVALLRSRLRSGLVCERDLELAVVVGDPAAAAVLARDMAPRHLLTCARGDLWQYVEKVEPWGTRAAIRLAVACARTLLRLGPEMGLEADALQLMRDGLEAAEAWLIAPSGRGARHARETSVRILHAQYAAERLQDLRFYALSATASTAQAASWGAIDEGTATARKKARTTARAAGASACNAAIALNMAGRDRRPLLNGIWWELSSWALGLADVVRDRP